MVQRVELFHNVFLSFQEQNSKLLGKIESLQDRLVLPKNWIVSSCVMRTIKESVSRVRYKLACGYSEDLNQSAHLHSLIRVLVFCLNNNN